MNHRKSPNEASMRIFIVIILLVLIGAIAPDFVPPLIGCGIKGNISQNTGERIYHVPGQKYYSATKINLLKGERWFCSEEVARAAGWRKSYI
jgi:hypothetical protein